jgi:hypothetical protein
MYIFNSEKYMKNGTKDLQLLKFMRTATNELGSAKKRRRES